MCTLFHDAAFFEHDDLVGLEDGVQTVGDGDDGLVLHQLSRGFFEQDFSLGVEAGGGFVENQDRCILQEGTRQGETLGLPAAEAGAAFADDGFIIRGQ